jgi:hypothetical protein
MVDWYVNQWTTITATVNASGGYANTATISAEADQTGEQQCYGTPIPMLESPNQSTTLPNER